MIKLKDLLLEGKPPSIFIPRRIEDRVERLISLYIRNGNKGDLDLDLSDLKLTKLPEILKDITVDGNFFCFNNNLTSLINAPSSVGDDFDCSYNDLTSLAGAPKTVGGFFDCTDNPVKFTEKQVRAVCDVKGKVYV